MHRVPRMAGQLIAAARVEEFLAAVGYAFIRTPVEAKSYLWAEPA